MSGGVQAAVKANGHSDALKAEPKVPAKASSPSQEQHVLNTVRCLAADLCQQFKGGHPGTVMGAAAIGVSLWRYHMRYNPLNPEWFDRDRFVLSAGHACLLQYLLLHFSGYPDWTLDAVKQYHAPTMTGMAAGHPEIEFPGIEVTTGPLGQGIANAVGMAMAAKSLAAHYNREGYPVVNNRIWCFTGDGCLQEGVGQEAISMAGHWGLDNLILIYDNNSVTVDGPIADCFTDDTSSKLRATGWHVLDVYDGSNDLAAITAALDEAKRIKGKPVCVNIRTIIGIGSQRQNTGAVHGQALGDTDVVHVKKSLGFDPEAKFVVSEDVYDYFKECKSRGAELEKEWEDILGKYSEKHSDLARDFDRRMKGQLVPWEDKVPTRSQLPKEPTATRKASGIISQTLFPRDNAFMVGSADILESTFVSWDKMVEFQKPDSGLGSYEGRQIRWGIREFAMAGAANGIAAYSKGTFLPVCSTFFMFWLYAAPAMRMAALQGLRVIGVATHDSIGIGEDGPTHQPIALASFYRALPGLNLIRPADAEEVMGAWQLALRDPDHPTILCLSRQAVPLLEGSNRDGVARGGYVVHGADSSPDLTLVSSGAEVSRAVATAKRLEETKGLKTRVVSVPSMDHFDKQTREYRREVIPRSSLVVAIEVYSSLGWARYAHAGCHMHTFGHSAPQDVLFEHFGFGTETLAEKIGTWVDGRKSENGWDTPEVGDYEELLLGHASKH